MTHSASQAVEHPHARAVSVPLAKRNRGRKILAGFFCFALLALLASSALAQKPKFEVIPLEGNLKQIDANLERVQRAASSFASTNDVSTFPAREAQGIRNYFSQYVPAKITQIDSLHQVNQVMGHARQTFNRAVRSGKPAARNLRSWLYSGLKPIALGNYHPAARINAINFIASLEAPAQRGGLPKPYSIVLTDLWPLYSDASNSDGVRAAALCGIERYVKLTETKDIDATIAGELKTAMNELLTSPAPADRDPLAHAFLQRYAVDILRYLNSDAELGKQLVSISTEDANPNLIAMHSISEFGRIPAKLDEGAVDTEAVLKKWSARVLEDFEAEVERITRLDTKLKAKSQPLPPESFVNLKTDNQATNGTGMMGGDIDDMMGMMGGMDMDMDDMMGMNGGMDMDMDDMMMGGMGGMGFGGMQPEVKPQPPEIVSTRKKLNLSLQSVLLGVIGSPEFPEELEDVTATQGLLAAAPAASQEPVAKWLETFKGVSDEVNNRSVDQRSKYLELLKEQVVILEALANGEAIKPKAKDDGPTGIDSLFGPASSDADEDDDAPGDDSDVQNIDDLIGQ
ncbi:MAG: hypothetical protein AAFV88_07375 [Planctomycetota bacterium]